MMPGTLVLPGWVAFSVLGLVAAQRLAELLIAKRNTRALLTRGAVEHGAAHYPYIVLLHAAWLAALAGWIAAAAPAVNLPLLALFAVLQAARVWVLRALGPYWTTRVITLPGAPLVRRGPYRFLRHPNYVVVVLEIAVLPLVFGAWMIALIFSALNAGLLSLRLRVENRILAERSGA